MTDDRPGPWRPGLTLVDRVFGFRALWACVARSAKGETQLLDLLSMAETSDAAAEFAYLQFQALPIKVRRRVWKAFARAQRPAKSKSAEV